MTPKITAAMKAKDSVAMIAVTALVVSISGLVSLLRYATDPIEIRNNEDRGDLCQVRACGWKG